MATTGWEQGHPVCLSGFSLRGLLDGCLLRDSSQHLAPVMVVPTRSFTRAHPSPGHVGPPIPRPNAVLGASWTFLDRDGLRCSNCGHQVPAPLANLLPLHLFEYELVQKTVAVIGTILLINITKTWLRN